MEYYILNETTFWRWSNVVFKSKKYTFKRWNVARRQVNDLTVLRSALQCKRSLSVRIGTNCQDKGRTAANHLSTMPDVFTNAFSNTRTQQLANNFWRPMGAYVIWMKINFGSFANAVQSSNTLCAKCSLPKNVIHASTQWPILSVRKSLLKNVLTPIFALFINHSILSQYFIVKCLNNNIKY